MQSILRIKQRRSISRVVVIMGTNDWITPPSEMLRCALHDALLG